MQFLGRESDLCIGPRTFLTVLALFRAMYRVPLPICLFEIGRRFSQRIGFKRLAFGERNARNRLVVERR